MSIKIKKNDLFLIILFAFILLTAVLIILSRTDVQINRTWTLVTAIINLGFAFWKLIAEVKSYSFSFSFMFYLFNFVFFGISPIVQSLSNWHAWGLNISDDEMLLSNFYILLWMIAFEIGRRIKVKFTVRKTRKKHKINYSLPLNPCLFALILLAIIVFTLFIFVGKGKLFFKGNTENITIDNSSLSLLQFHILRNGVYFLSVIPLIHSNETGKQKWIALISFVLFVLGAFPTGLSRYMAGAFWGGYLIHLIQKKHIGKWFPIVLVLGILIIFPISSGFRYITGLYSFSELQQIISKTMTISESYNSGNYDAYQMLGGAIRYVNLYGFSKGYQLIGACLFFIPRSIWASKPIGTGAMVLSGLTSSSFTNVSMPLIGETYVNYGVVGILVFAVVLGYFIDRIDRLYWSEWNNCNPVQIIYPSSMLYFFFMNRGDLLSSGSYLVAHIVMGILITKLSIKKEYI